MGRKKNLKNNPRTPFFLALEGVRGGEGTLIFPSLIGNGNKQRWGWRGNIPLKFQIKIQLLQTNVSFVPSTVSAPLLAAVSGKRRTSFPPPPNWISRIFCDTLFVVSILLLLLPCRPPPATLSTVSVMTCDPRGQPITVVLFQKMRGLCLAGPRQEGDLICGFLMLSLTKNKNKKKTSWCYW